MTTTNFPELHPNVSRLGDAFKIISEELPRLSNLDSSAILRILQELRDDLRHNLVAQDDLGTLLDNKLTRIQENLISLESRMHKLDKYFNSIGGRDDVGWDRDRTSTKVEDGEDSKSLKSTATATNRSSIYVPDVSNTNPSGIVPRNTSSQASWDIFHGPSGALIFIFVTMIPILAVLMWSELK